MIGTLQVIGITVAVAASFFLVGAASILLGLRARDKRHRDKEEIARDIRNGQRVRLSVGSSNYSHVTEPMTNLRRSVRLPCGIVSESWTALPSQEDLAQRQVVQSAPRPPLVSSHPRRGRSLRASFSAHSLSLPKTRRQKKIEKAIPLGMLPRSPLSAITECSGTNTSNASPAIGIAELPTHLTPRSTPEKTEDALPAPRPSSVQWPLGPEQRVSGSDASTTTSAPQSRKHTLVRMDSTGRSVSPIRTALGQRSTSIVSALSLAPEDPLPPLPSITPTHWSQGQKGNLRLSTASVETIGSSVLAGGGQASPSQFDTNLTSIGSGTPIIDLNPTRLRPFERNGPTWEPAAVITTGSPNARHTTRYHSGKSAYGSFRASIGHQSSVQSIQYGPRSESYGRSSLTPQPIESSLTVIDTSSWKFGGSSRANSLKAPSNSSLQTVIGSTMSNHKKGMLTVRHSMYEQNSRFKRSSVDPAVLRDVSGNQKSPLRDSSSTRSASMVSENPFHWDGDGQQTGLSSAMKGSPGSHRKGHKRQNCVRLSIIPPVDASRGGSRLSQMAEEDEDGLEEPSSISTTIPGLSLLEQERTAGQASLEAKEVECPPALNRPDGQTKQPRFSRDISCESTLSLRQDGDVFRSSDYDLSPPNIFTQNLGPQWQWPWPSSPASARHSGPQPTPPALKDAFKDIRGPYEPDSPTLPRPDISSAALFVTTPSLGSRVSGVQGPRSLPRSRPISRTASPTPLTSRGLGKREDLRRSVMMLRRMNTDAREKSRASQIYRNIGDEENHSLPDESEKNKLKPHRQASVSIVDVSSENLRPSAATSRFHLPSPRYHQQALSSSPSTTFSALPANDPLRFSKSRSKLAPSPSTVSAGATSVWEDVSVRGDSPEPELPPNTASEFSPPPPQQQMAVALDREARENFVTTSPHQDQKQSHARDRDAEREKKLTSPQGKGLGLMGMQVHGKVWGTPGSLYDGEGFLKE